MKTISRQEQLLFFYLIISGYCICLINSFGQHHHHGQTTTAIIHHPNGRNSRRQANGRRRRRGLNNNNVRNNNIDSNNILLALSTPQDQEQKQQQYRGGPRKSYSNNNNNNTNNSNSNNHRYKRPKYKTKKESTSNEFGLFNKKIMQQETAQDLLNVVASRKGALSSIGGGGKLSTVNFSTSIHRLARHMTQYTSKNKPGNDRSHILSDPRFALLICSTAEALLDGAEETGRNGSKKQFEARNLANVAWAIAKINIAPPDTVIPVDLDNAKSLLRVKSEHVRSIIFDIAKQRATSSSTSSSSSSSWIPALSELCGLLIDTVSVKALELDPKRFQQQELSNLMWSLATAQRPNERVFEFVVNSIVASAEQRKRDVKSNETNPLLSRGNNSNNKNGYDLLVPQEWSIPLWVLAKSGVDLGHEEELLPFVKDMMDNEPGFLERFKPQELSNSVWAAATIISKRPQVAEGEASDAALGILRHTSRELIRRDGDGYKTQEVTNHAWAMATLGFGITTSEKGTTAAAAAIARGCQLTHSYTYLHSDDSEGDRLLMEEVMQITKRKIQQNIRPFTSQELNNICWVMARLGIKKDEELLGLIGKEISNPRKRVNSQDLSTTLWSMATMEYYDEKLYRGIVSRLPDIGSEHFKPQELSNILWALATAGVIPDFPTVFDEKLLPTSIRPTIKEAKTDPVTAIFAAGAAELISRPDEFKTQEIKDVLWAFAKVGVRHPQLFRTVAEYLVGEENEPVTGRGLSDFNSQGLANLAYSYARQAQIGGETLDKYEKKCRIAFTGGRLAHFTVIFLDVGEGRLRKLFVEIAKANLEVHDNMSKCSAQDISNTVWAFAVLGLKHTKYLEAVEATMRSRMGRYLDGNKGSMNRIQGQEMSNTLWAMAALNYTPRGLLNAVETYFMELINHDLTVPNISRVISRQEMANMVWVVAVFGEYPTKLVELLYMGILGIGDRSDPEYLQQHYGDNGILPTHFNSMVYLQTIMDLELGREQNPFALPDDFPSAWSSNPSLTAQCIASSPSTDTNGIMELNTSAVQNRISAAFDRIDFGHVDEHLLTMKDLALDYGIQLAPTSVDILSLDIANIESKIGVEVDGPGHWVSNIDSDNIISSTGKYIPPRGKEGMWEYNFNWNSNDQTMNGSTSLKLRMFHKLGWRLINIPFWDWVPIDDIGRDNNKRLVLQEEYCRSLLSNEDEEQ